MRHTALAWRQSLSASMPASSACMMKPKRVGRSRDDPAAAASGLQSTAQCKTKGSAAAAIALWFCGDHVCRLLNVYPDFTVFGEVGIFFGRSGRAGVWASVPGLLACRAAPLCEPASGAPSSCLKPVSFGGWVLALVVWSGLVRPRPFLCLFVFFGCMLILCGVRF